MRPRIRCEAFKVEKLVLNDRDGESGDRSVRAEKVLQRMIQSHMVSEVREERKSPDDDGGHQYIAVIEFANTTCVTSR